MAELPEFYTSEQVLVVVAHADDIEFGISGTVARWTEAGTKVSYCIVTNNSSGSNEPDADLNALSETRKNEQLASAKAVGVTDVRFLGYQDGILQPTLELRKEITALIREIKPQIVITFDPRTVFSGGGYVNHPDHRAVGEATTYAVFPSAETRPIFSDLLDRGLEPHKVQKLFLVLSESDNYQVDISSTFERKSEALLCHKSQLDEKVIEMIRKWNSEAAKDYDAEYIESFHVIHLDRSFDDVIEEAGKESPDNT